MDGIQDLVNQLSSARWEERLDARDSLVDIGDAAIKPLEEVLQGSGAEKARWEAIKALSAIGDARSIPSLVRALEDNESDIAWLAAEALEKFRMAAWLELLIELIRIGPESVAFRNGVHHIMRNQREKGFNDLLEALIHALESDSSPESAPVAAADLIDRLRTRKNEAGRLLNKGSRLSG